MISNMFFPLTTITLWYFHLTVVIGSDALKLIAYISQNGLHGEFYFSQITTNQIEIVSQLETTLQYPDQLWSWGIYELPIDYSNPSKTRCDFKNLGKQIHTFDESLGYLTLPGNESSTWIVEASLTGVNGVWGRSLLLFDSSNDFKICATILTTRNSKLENMAEAHFHSATIGGTINFRWLTDKSTVQHDTLIYADLYHTNLADFDNKQQQLPYTKHPWKIFVTDIFDSDTKRSDDCKILQLIFDPHSNGTGKSIGDIDNRLGKLKITKNIYARHAKEIYFDKNLYLLPYDLNGPQRRLYIVIYDDRYAENVLACAKIRYVRPRVLKSIINGNGLKGEITFVQQTKYEPTWLNFTIASSKNDTRTNLEYARDIASYYITDLPLDPVLANQTKSYCNSSGTLYNPLNIEFTDIPPSGYGTQDQYPIGDLTGKLLNRNRNYSHNYYIQTEDRGLELNGIYWDLYLPLENSYSIVHRSIIIRKFNRTEELTNHTWTCSSLVLYESDQINQMDIFTAQILFRYPIVGRIILRQPKDEPWLDTSILFEYLIHADGSTQNNSDSHRWAIHLNPPGPDFYNWSGRCLSAHDVFNPYKIQYIVNNTQEPCSQLYPEVCRLGDLSNRLPTLTIAGSKLEKHLSRKLFTDKYLPLTGHQNIIGKSFIIYDDFGPKARGERLACSIISGYHRRKIVARDWYANGGNLYVSGKLEMIQQTEYDITDVEVKFKGLKDTSGYHVHMTPVEGDLEFPCEDTTLYGHFNPRNVDPKKSPTAGQGTTDQYEMGDLSGKFGTLNGLTEYSKDYRDLTLPLFGYESLLGRSIVIHKLERNFRWACSTLERGYSPSEAREIRGIASFHHPLGYAYGYMRLTQLIHNDGSKSDTVIEVKLRHPGINDRNLTRNHHWQIFVNPVGVDAAVKQTVTRCVAGGYVWNPYYTQLADPLNVNLYKSECGADNPLRCYVGDVSARIGTIDLGDKRVVFSDPNFPLEGEQSAIGRSIVIFGPEYSNERFACANIESDHDIVKYINLLKPPKFVVSQFLQEIRQVMGIPEWMLSVDTRKTKLLHDGACIQMIIHFKGPIAHKLELDFSHLFDVGRLSAPSLYIPGYIDKKRKSTIPYKICDTLEIKKSKTVMKSASSKELHGKKLFIGFIIMLPMLVNVIL